MGSEERGKCWSGLQCCSVNKCVHILYVLRECLPSRITLCSLLTVPHKLMQTELKLSLQGDTGNLYCRPKKGEMARVITVSEKIQFGVALSWFS